jgi:hypothetical protein
LPNATPNWQQALNDYNQSGNEFVVAPITNNYQKMNGDAKLLIFRDSARQLRGVFMIYLPDEAYRIQTNGNYNPSTYTGIIVYTDINGQAILSSKVNNGQIQNLYDATIARETGGAGLRSCLEIRIPCEGITLSNCGVIRFCDCTGCGVGSGGGPGRGGAGTGTPIITVVGPTGGGSAPGYNFSFGGVSTTTNGNSNSGNTGGSWGGSQPNSVFTDNALMGVLSNTTWAKIKDNIKAKSLARNFFSRRGGENAAAIDNNIDLVEVTTLFNEHLIWLTNDDEYFQASKDANFPQAGSEAWEESIKDPILIAKYLYNEYNSECAVLKKLYPFASDSDIRWTAAKNVLSDATHLGLDLCGLIPAVGEPCDFANGVFYTIQGEGVNAALSFAATVPIVGWVSTGGKYAMKVIGVSGRTYNLSYKVVNGVVEFGTKDNLRKQLRNVLNLTVGDGLFAHHVIPLDLTQNADLLQKATQMIQKAASFKAAFHPNEVNNGIALAASVHSGGHLPYIANVKAALERLYDANGGANITPQHAHQLLQGLMAKIRNEMLMHPTTHIDDLIF